jgi:hypothetical protein
MEVCVCVDFVRAEGYGRIGGPILESCAEGRVGSATKHAPR